MAISTKKKEEILKLAGAYDELFKRFLSLDAPMRRDLHAGWSKGREKLLKLFEVEPPGVKASAVISGLEQGLREMPQSLNDFADEVRDKALAVYFDVMTSVLPGWLEKDATYLRRIVKRGRIINESEFYLIRNSIDRLEGGGEEELLQSLCSLVDAYEKDGLN